MMTLHKNSCVFTMFCYVYSTYSCKAYSDHKRQWQLTQRQTDRLRTAEVYYHLSLTSDAAPSVRTGFSSEPPSAAASPHCSLTTDPTRHKREPGITPLLSTHLLLHGVSVIQLFIVITLLNVNRVALLLPWSKLLHCFFLWVRAPYIFTVLTGLTVLFMFTLPQAGWKGLRLWLLCRKGIFLERQRCSGQS